MANALSSALTSIEGKLSTAGTTAAASIIGFFSTSLLTLAEDELAILGDAIEALYKSKQAGRTWEEALTDAYNEFYNEEVAEGSKIAMAFLEAVSKILATIEAAV